MEHSLIRKTWNIELSLQEWDAIREDIIRLMMDSGFEKKETVAFLVGVEEMFANVVYYAFPNGFGNEDFFRIDCNEIELDGKGGIEVVLRDTGIPFDPLKREMAQPAKNNIKDLKPGGFGIMLAIKRSDSISYEWLNGNNVLAMRKYRKTA